MTNKRQIDIDTDSFYAIKESQEQNYGAQQASKAGDSPRRADLSNFLATDEVPETLFGIPIVASPEQYTEADIAFFKEHPRAGGFYELGDEDTDTQAAEGAEGAGSPPPVSGRTQPAPVIPRQVKKQDIAFISSPGLREDGTYKGEGWSSFKLSDGRDVTEYSIGVNIDGQEILIPTVVPSLSLDQIKRLKGTIEEGKDIPKDIVDTAVAFAKSRLKVNKSPFKNDGLSPEDYRSMRNSKLRQFTQRKGHESLKGMYWERDAKNPDSRTIWLLPGMDRDGNRDVFGYRTFRKDDGTEYTLGNTSASDVPITLAKWREGARKTDERLSEVTLKNLKNWGVTSRKGREILFPLVWDISFPAGETSARNKLFTRDESPNFNKRRDSLITRGVDKERATILAFLDQAADYQENKNRSRARLSDLIERMEASGDQEYVPFIELYRDKYGKHQAKKTDTLDNQLFSKHEAGINAVREALDEHKAETSTPGNKSDNKIIHAVYDHKKYGSVSAYLKAHGLTVKRWKEYNPGANDRKVKDGDKFRVR